MAMQTPNINSANAIARHADILIKIDKFEDVWEAFRDGIKSLKCSVTDSNIIPKGTLWKTSEAKRKFNEAHNRRILAQ